MIAFLDLETTGLDPKKDSILEIAIVLTDDDLNELGTFQSFVKPLHGRGIEVMDDFCRAMHEKNGIISSLYNVSEVQPFGRTLELKPNLPRLGEVEGAIVEWLRQKAYYPEIPKNGNNAAVADDPLKVLRATPLGGNSVHFDRSFLREHMDDLEKLFSHRHADCSAINEFAKRWTPSLHAGRPGAGGEVAHRALADVHASIETAKFYRQFLFMPPKEAQDRFELKKEIVDDQI
jgi:oligoribonuclease